MKDLRPAAERIAGALADAGLARLPARVFAALLVDDDGRMTVAELTGFLDVSAASISSAVTYLSPLGMVRREREGRRDVYVVDDDAWYASMTRHEQIYAPIKAALGAAVDALGDSPGAERVALSREFLEFLTAEMNGVIERWDRHVTSRTRRAPGSP